jgi:hypothetical protein
MSDVNVTTDSDVSFSNPGDPVVVLADDDIETIVVNEQGPPGHPEPQGAPSLVPGPPGPQGIPGADGNTVLYGPTNPVGTTGVNGNFYINTTTNFMFGPKAGGAWPAGTSLVGPQGPQGVQGAQGVQGPIGNTGAQGPQGNTGAVGPQGPQGAQGAQGIPGNTVLYGAGPPASGTGVNGNFYIDTTASFIYGPKAAGAWPAGTSLVGPQGPQGPQGVQGPTGPVPEAPTDGQTYGRKSSAWTPVTSGVPSGTVMLFWQAAAPTGWTQVTTQNDKALRVVSGAGGVAGGTNAFSTVMAQTVVGNHTLAAVEEAPHTHTLGYAVGYSGPTAWAQIPNSGGINLYYSLTTDSQSSGGGSSHNHPITMQIQYIDIILASKN